MNISFIIAKPTVAHTPPPVPWIHLAIIRINIDVESEHRKLPKKNIDKPKRYILRLPILSENQPYNIPDNAAPNRLKLISKVTISIRENIN